MADDTTTPLAGLDPEILKQLYAQTQQLVQPPPQDQAPPVSRSITSLLGEALAGGSGPGLTSAQQETEGGRALLNFGLNMLAASGPSQIRRGFGQIVAQGLQGAQAGAQGYEAQIADWQQRQAELQMQRMKAMEPLINTAMELQKFNLTQQQIAQAKKALLGQTGTTGAASSDYVGTIGTMEGTGKNPRSSAFGTGQFIEPTWMAFAAANPELFKGMSNDQILAARADPTIGA